MPEIIFFGGLDDEALPEGPSPHHIESACEECGKRIQLWEMHEDYKPLQDEIIFHICPPCFVRVLAEHEDLGDQLHMLAGEYPGRRITLNAFRRIADAHSKAFFE